MKITLSFLEPFRMLDWIAPEERIPGNRSFTRGFTFAKWHKIKANDKGRPFITGTLLRSAVLRAAERLLVLSDGRAGEKECCSGNFSTDTKKAGMFLRKRATLKWSDKRACNADSPCPFCELLGPGAAGKRKDMERNSFINFGNLNLPNESEHEYASPRAIALRRVVNRVDYTTGKAHDFFRIFEVDPLLFPCFQGEITIGEGVSTAAVNLLKNSLRFTDQLCGGLCVIRCQSSVGGGQSSVGGGPLAVALAVPDDQLAVASGPLAVESVPLVVEGQSADNRQQSADKSERLRLLASCIRELRRDKEMVSNLPLDHDKVIEELDPYTTDGYK